MAQNESKPQTLPEKLQSLPKGVLYLILIVVTAVPLFFSIKLPNVPVESSIDLYQSLASLKEGSTVLVSSDWTTSTRGENGGQMEAILRILMRRKVKFVIFSIADPNAPEVAKKVIQGINDERKAAGEKPYVQWQDWVDAGFFPNGEGTANALVVGVKEAFAGKKDLDDHSQVRDIFESPVLAHVSKLSDTPVFIDVTGSNTSKVFIQRLSGKIPLAFTVTGVMGPETFNYYASGQLTGLAVGIKGVYDLETLMETGVNVPTSEYVSGHKDPAPGFPGMINMARGMQYYPSLNAAMFLLILAVVVGNIGMVLAKKRAS